MSDGKKVRVGIIGAGSIVKQRHLPGLRAIPEVEIVAVCNASLASAEAFCREFAPGAKPIARWEDLVDNADVDVVWIGATPYLHSDATCFALQCGKHAFCQARMAADLQSAERMWEAALRYPDQIVAICPAPYGMKGGEVVKKLLAEGAIGRPHQMLLHSCSDAWLDTSKPAHWRQRTEVSGIQILTLGIFVEVVQRWLGDIVEVGARGRVVFSDRDGYEVDIPDLLHVLCRFRDGIEGVMIFSGVAAHAPADKFYLFGSEGSLSYDFATDEIMLGRRGETMTPVPVPPELAREWTVEKDFIAAVLDPAAPRPRPDVTEGIRYMRVVDAVWKSMDAGSTVQFG